MIGDKQARAIWAHGNTCNHWIQRRNFRFEAIRAPQTCFVAERYRFFRLAPLATFTREEMDIVVFAAARIKMRTIGAHASPT